MTPTPTMKTNNNHNNRQQQLHILLLVVIGLFCLLSATNMNLKSYHPSKIEYGLITTNNNNNNNKSTVVFVEEKEYTIERKHNNHHHHHHRQQRRPPVSETFHFQPEFPRWGGDSSVDDDDDDDDDDDHGINGINIKSIQSFLSKSRHTNKFHVYIFGGNGRSGSGDAAKQQQKPQLYVSNLRRRSYFGDGAFYQRLKPTERLLEDSLQYLVKFYNNDSIDDDDDDHHHQQQQWQRKWSRLWEVVQGSSNKSPGIPLILQLGDNRGCNKYNDGKNSSVPILTVCASYHDYNCNHSFPIPAYSLLSMIHQMDDDWDDYFHKQDTKYPWSDKVRQVVWRGSDTGALPLDINLINNSTNMKFYSSLRWMMVYEATKKTKESSSSTTTNNFTTNMFDVGFHRTMKPNKEWQSFVHDDNAQFPKVGGITKSDFQKYIGVLDVDGNAWSSRFVELLAMNSVVLKVEPESVDYFMPKLIPWEHFVPIKMDSSDLIDIVEYVLDPNNYDEMRQIVTNAHNWVKENFTYEKMIVDMLNILDFYVQKLDQYDRDSSSSSSSSKNNNNNIIKETSSWTDQFFDQMMNDKEFVTTEEITPLSRVHFWSRQRLAGWRGVPPSCSTTTRSKQALFGCQG